MKKEPRKISLLLNSVHRDDEDRLDVLFWLSKTPTERLQEVVRLRKQYFTWLNGSFPLKIEKVVNRKVLNV